MIIYIAFCLIFVIKLKAQNNCSNYSEYNPKELRVKFLGFGMDLYCGGISTNEEYMSQTFDILKEEPNTALEFSQKDKVYYISVSESCLLKLITVNQNYSIIENDSIIIKVITFPVKDWFRDSPFMYITDVQPIKID